MADTHMDGYEGFLYILEDHAVEKFPGEVQAGSRSAHCALVLCEDGLVVLNVLRGGLFLHPFRNIGLSKAEEGFLELLIGAVKEEPEGAAAGGCIVNYLCHKGLILSEIQFIADTNLAGWIHDHVPEALLTVELAEKQDHYIGPGLFLLAIHTGRKHLCVVKDKDVSLSEIIYDVFEEPVLYLTGVFVEHHETGFVAPAGRLRCNTILREVEVELRKFHFAVLVDTLIIRPLPQKSFIA